MTKTPNKVFTQQIDALTAVRDRLGAELEQAADLILSKPGKVVVGGIGKSGIVAHKTAATLASTGTSAVFLNAGEALHGDLGMVGADDVLLMFSKSARTAELAHMLPSVRKIGAAIVGILGASDTVLSEACDIVLDVSVDEEACPLQMAPTTSSTVAMVMGDALAVLLMEKRGFTPDHFALYHPGGDLGRRLLYQVRDVMKSGDRVPCVSPHATLREALTELSRCGLGAVCIVDPSLLLLGILTEGDVRRLFVAGTNVEVPIADVMTPSPRRVLDTATLGDALDLMEQKGGQIYVLPVVDEHKRTIGMLRMHDIVT